MRKALVTALVVYTAVTTAVTTAVQPLSAFGAVQVLGEHPVIPLSHTLVI